jgi:hypothetical protein
MAGKAMVAATDEMFTTAPPPPALPPGRIARNACFMPSSVPATFTSSMRRRSSPSTSITSEVISMPALFTRMSKPPSSFTVVSVAEAQSASFVTSSGTKPTLAPEAESRDAVSRPRSASTSPIITLAPAAASASAMLAPMPRAPPVTSALRPFKSNLAITCLLSVCCEMERPC